ncbi:hypothetical protein GCM10023170_077520 [Phytohabitans houttuyneae]
MGDLTVPVVLIILGGVCLLIALSGGGFGGTISIPTLGTAPRVVAGVLASVLLGGGILLYVWEKRKDDPRPDPTPTQSIAPSVHPTPSKSPSVSETPSHEPVRYDKDFVVQYIDNTGHIDLDEPRSWNGDMDENQGVVDIAVTPGKVASENFAKIALSEAGGKAACLDAISQEAPKEISMGQVQDDEGFCAISDHGLVAYVKFLDLVAGNGDHAIRIRVTAYG